MTIVQGQHQNNFGCINIRPMRGKPLLIPSAVDQPVQFPVACFGFCVPGNTLAAVTDFGHQRPKRGKHFISVGDNRAQPPSYLAWFTWNAHTGLFSNPSRPVLRQFSWRIMQCRYGKISFPGLNAQPSARGIYVQFCLINIPIGRDSRPDQRLWIMGV